MNSYFVVRMFRIFLFLYACFFYCEWFKLTLVLFSKYLPLRLFINTEFRPWMTIHVVCQLIGNCCEYLVEKIRDCCKNNRTKSWIKAEEITKYLLDKFFVVFLRWKKQISGGHVVIFWNLVPFSFYFVDFHVISLRFALLICAVCQRW